ncbi:peroxisome biogenesis protein 3-1-like isoform X2 [Durio zibethinus]|uniref:Peroxisome biogenesis protein 3-1-like isoform X2 n=1 Tax=Durio zibethinus TaxID=66656 RepID=A0A6P5XCP6_DURZI|nr:peroxisome biogenesis protein 3-1-like isoform X2 [Durio zibethinus]
MQSLRDLWRRHRRNVLVTAGILGSGYFLYKLYDAHKRRLTDLERQLAIERENDEFIKAQMQVHFENIQRIADTTTLPHAMHYLSCRIAEDLDLSHLTERLMKGKGQPNSLSSAEKLELWDMLKILSFTRIVVSIWAVTMLSLYIRVQVNILGRHLYIDTAHGLGSPHLLEDADLIHRDDQQNFLASADFLANYGLPKLISNMQTAATEVLKAAEFGSVVEISLNAVVNALVEEKGFQSGGGSLTLGMPLARLLPRIAQICPSLVEEPSKNKFIQIIQSVPEVGLFFTLLYANLSTS